MTNVGTPIYVAPEVMVGSHYDATADSYSFGICLVAMIRGEKDVVEFYYQALRKTMMRKTKKGVGITILNNRMYNKGWRPLLPLEFERNYPKLCTLLKRCWAPKKEDRPSFDEIVKVLQGEVSYEVRRKEEPVLVMYSLEDDQLYQERMGVTEEFSDEEEGLENTVGKVRRETMKEMRKQHEEVLSGLKEKVRRLEERELARELETPKAAEPTKAADTVDTTADKELGDLMAMMGC